MVTSVHTTWLRSRLVAQQLARPRFRTPRELVSWLGAVQAQDYGASKWAVGLRLSGASDQDVEDAVAQGAILRTHALRFTWQLVAPEDVRWILTAAASPVVARSGTRNRQLGLDAATFRRSNAAMEKALASGGALTREELAAALGKSGVSTEGQRLAHILGHAELAGLISGGPRRGKQFTYVLLEAHAPARGTPLARDEALAELARRYFRSRGPATLADFKWWSGLPAADARAALDSVASELAREDVSGRAYYRAPGAPPRTGVRSRAILLPAFDEYILAYQDRDAMVPARYAKRLNAGGGILAPCVVLDGVAVGRWSRTLARDEVSVKVDLFERPSRAARDAIAKAARHHADFLGLALASVSVA